MAVMLAATVGGAAPPGQAEPKHNASSAHGIVSAARAPIPPSGADMPLELETPYAEAVVAYYSGNYRLTLRLLDRIDSASISGSDKIKIMELRALALQYDGQYTTAVDLYRQLLQLATEQNAPPLKLILYDYQMGVLLMQRQRWLEARLHLERSLPKGINRAYTAFLLGRAAYEMGDDRAAAIYLRAARNTASEITKPAVAYYLGLSLARTGNPVEASTLWQSARAEAASIQSQPDSSPTLRDTMRELGEGIDRALSQHFGTHLTGNVGIVTAYDSNPLLMSTSDAPANGQDTFSQMLRYQLGLRTQPADTLEITPVLSGFTNFNSNSDTRIAQYLAQSAGLIFALNPDGSFRYGLRLDGRYLGRYNPASSSVGTESFDGSLGLFVEDRPTPRQEWGIALSGQRLSFQTDPQFDARLAMSGTVFELRGHWGLETHRHWWNPRLDGSFFYENTDGSEWRNYGTELVLSDAVRLGDSLTWYLRMALASKAFPDRTADLSEFPLRIGWDLSYCWQDSLRFGTQFSYLRNVNNTDSPYDYERYLLSVSMDYFF